MILHMDMDAFFASVEQRDNPELRGKPVIIGGDSQRGVVSTASYEARKYGVHSAMPVFQAKKLCPNGIFIPGSMGKYQEASRKIFSLLEVFSPVIQPVSIDEAYVDITGCEKVCGTPREIAEQIKGRVLEHVGLTCSVGIAPVKFLSKIASDINKPDGITIIETGEIEAFISTLPIGKVPGVGKITLKQMKRLSVEYLGDIRAMDEKLLVKCLGIFGRRLKELSLGMDSATVTTGSARKSISSETTLERNTRELEHLRLFVLTHAEDVARQLRLKRVRAKTVTLKITYADFRQITRQKTLKSPTHSSEVLFREAMTLLEQESLSMEIRLIGVGSAGLVPESHPTQIELFSFEPKKSENWQRGEKAMDSIIDKFGSGSVTRAILARQPDDHDTGS